MNPAIIAPPIYANGNIVLQYAKGTGIATYTFPYAAAVPDLATVSAKLDDIAARLPPQFDAPFFVDTFGTDDPSRWMVASDDNFPPRPGTPGTWLRIYPYGWPSNTGTQDTSARGFHNEGQSYEDKGVVIAPGGGLQLVATRDTVNHFAKPWTSGVITQNRDLALCYGYFEMVAKLPLGQGLWPAFWLMPAAIGTAGELDVMEQLGHDPKTIYCTPHGAPPYVAICQPVTVPDVTAGFHKYGLLWTKEFCTWFFDDKQVDQQPTPPEANAPHFMLANLAVGDVGSWPGPYDATTPSPSVMTVRSIASYALNSWKGTIIPKTPPV
ncbi:MAG: glycoside hydrolase family 16 protein [Janthinobacterium lividum]